MSVLTRKEITKRIKDGSIAFQPELDQYQLQGHSVDLRLGFTFMIPKAWRMTKNGREPLHIDFYDPEHPDYLDIVELEKGQYFDLLPREHVLVSSLETVTIPRDLMAVMYPRSSTNRKGISVDLTGIVDSGYEGQLVIPIRNNTESQVVRLYPGERFCQIVFESLTQLTKSRESRYHRMDVIDGIKVGTLHGEDEEIKYIRSGDISKLKTKFSLDKNK